MEDAPKKSGLYVALAAAQLDMGPVLKDAKNDAFKRDGKALAYATLQSVIEACLPALNKQGIAVIQPTGMEGDQRYVKTVFVHGESGETSECRVPLIVSKNDMQGYGSAVTYARRYGLMCMAGIAPEDDDGNAAAAAAPKSDPRRDDKPKDQPPSADQVDHAVGYVTDAETLADLKTRWTNLPPAMRSVQAVGAAKDARKTALEAAPANPNEAPF